MRRCVCIFLAIIILMSSLLTVNATDLSSATGNVGAKICKALSIVEPHKSLYGLDNVDFSKIYVGSDPINLYDYKPSGFEKTRVAYPLFEDEVLIALALQVNENNYQITTALVDEINNRKIEDLAIVYDQDSIYFYDGDEYAYIMDQGAIDASRAKLRLGAVQEKLDTTNVKANILLNYCSNESTRAQTAGYHGCNVTLVRQYSYNICWAASMACIVNYLFDTAYTATQVAINCLGAADFNQGQTTSQVASHLYIKYGLNYGYLDTRPTLAVIDNNLANDFPVYGYLLWDGPGSTETAHAVTIFGSNVLMGYINIMDPNGNPNDADSAKHGVASCQINTSTGYFEYATPFENKTYVLKKMCCRYWTTGE